MDATEQVLLLIPFIMRTVRLTEIKLLVQDHIQNRAESPWPPDRKAFLARLWSHLTI